MAKLGAGITNKQAKYLAALCRELKMPYAGRGMSRQDASLTIAALQARVDERQAKLRKRLQR